MTHYENITIDELKNKPLVLKYYSSLKEDGYLCVNFGSRAEKHIHFGRDEYSSFDKFYSEVFNFLMMHKLSGDDKILQICWYELDKNLSKDGIIPLTKTLVNTELNPSDSGGH